MAIFSRVQVDERKKTLPLSSAHSIIETHKKYMKAILDMKNNGEPMTYITFKGSVLTNTTPQTVAELAHCYSPGKVQVKLVCSVLAP
jgi:hypothetical protein